LVSESQFVHGTDEGISTDIDRDVADHPAIRHGIPVVIEGARERWRDDVAGIRRRLGERVDGAAEPDDFGVCVDRNESHASEKNCAAHINLHVDERNEASGVPRVRDQLVRESESARNNNVVNFFDAEVYVRSEEHTSELQSQSNLVCRLLLEKKKK